MERKESIIFLPIPKGAKGRGGPERCEGTSLSKTTREPDGVRVTRPSATERDYYQEEGRTLFSTERIFGVRKGAPPTKGSPRTFKK